MAADYPGAIKNFLQLEDGVDTVVAQHPNERGDEITAIETELGINVAGSISDLVTRLAVGINNDGTLKDDAVDTGVLKTATEELSVTNGNTTKVAWTSVSEYGYWPLLKASDTSGAYTAMFCAGSSARDVTFTTSYASYILLGADSAKTIYAQQRYVTSSGTDLWIFLLIDKVKKSLIAASCGNDHPSQVGREHPFSDYDKLKHEVAIIEKSQCAELFIEWKETGKTILTLVNETYEIDENSICDYVPLHSGKFVDKEKVMVAKLPDYINVRKLKRRVS